MIDINEIRKQVQTALTTMVTSEVAKYSCGVPKADSAIVEGQTYYGYDLQFDYAGSDFDNNYDYNIRINGLLVRLYDPTEDTIKIVDEACNQLLKKLKTMNFKPDVKYINLDNRIRKINVTGTVKFSELSSRIIR